MKQRTIRSLDNVVCLLSDEVYVITTDEHPSRDYQQGALVRLIARKPDRIPGDHFDENYLTVCKINAKEAYFCGIPKRDLIKIDLDLLKQFS